MRRKNGRYNPEVEGQIARESEELPKDAFKTGGLEVAHHLVKRAERKLVGLHANRSQLRKRIRALHYLLKTLGTVISPSEPHDPGLHPATQESVCNQDGSAGFEMSSGTPVASPAGPIETGTGLQPTSASTELRRACRIALMESDRPQGCEQILQRIRRRGSVCIEGIDDPKAGITHELRMMVAEGEVIQKKDSQLWQLNRDIVRIVAEANFARK